jgi:hypothetical protein
MEYNETIKQQCVWLERSRLVATDYAMATAVARVRDLSKRHEFLTDTDNDRHDGGAQVAGARPQEHATWNIQVTGWTRRWRCRPTMDDRRPGSLESGTRRDSSLLWAMYVRWTMNDPSAIDNACFATIIASIWPIVDSWLPLRANT